MGRRVAGGLAAAALALASAAPAGADPPNPCPGDEIEPDQVIEGSFDSDLQGSYVLIPFAVPRGTTQVRVKYCYDQPESPTSSQVRHTLDLGLYEPRKKGSHFWGEEEFRGWGGSSHPDVSITPQGFSSKEKYLDDPKGHVPGKTTRGFKPGAVSAGKWAVELGLAAIVDESEGDSDGEVEWRVEIELSSKKGYADDPYRPARYDSTPARKKSDWYAGDIHVHAEHSSLGAATMRETFDFAFEDEDGPKLDFITLSDYVTDSAWGEIGRFQDDYPGHLIIRSAEVITYRGHATNHASVRYVDYRTGPLYKRKDDGELELWREAKPASRIFKRVLESGGFTQINHPTIFPSLVPGFGIICRGCSWDYTPQETDYSKVDAIEVQTGPSGFQEEPHPGPNPFTPLAIELWESQLAAGHHIAAVGSSDSQHAGERDNPILQSPIGHATTVVFADELSESGIKQGVRAGHTYVKLFGNDGPDLRFEATGPESDKVAIIGDTLKSGSATFTARVIGGSAEHQLLVVKDGVTILTVPVTSNDFTFSFPSVGAGRYRLQLQRGSAIDALCTPIWLEPA